MIVIWLDSNSASGKVKALGFHPHAEEVEDLELRPHVVVETEPEFKTGYEMYYDFDSSCVCYEKTQTEDDQEVEDVLFSTYDDMLTDMADRILALEGA